MSRTLSRPEGGRRDRRRLRAGRRVKNREGHAQRRAARAGRRSGTRARLHHPGRSRAAALVGPGTPSTTRRPARTRRRRAEVGALPEIVVWTSTLTSDANYGYSELATGSAADKACGINVESCARGEVCGSADGGVMICASATPARPTGARHLRYRRGRRDGPGRVVLDPGPLSSLAARVGRGGPPPPPAAAAARSKKRRRR